MPEGDVAGGQGSSGLAGQVAARVGGGQLVGGPGHRHVLGAAPEAVVKVHLAHLSRHTHRVTDRQSDIHTDRQSDMQTE